MKLKIKVKGMRETEREIARLRRQLGISGGEFADLAAKTVSQTVARNAQPFGLGKKSMEKGVGAIRKDLSKIFQLVPDSAGSRGSVISTHAAAKVWHQSRRGSRGRTREGRKKLITASLCRAYAETVAKRVGMAKGSVTGGGDVRLQGRFAKWISRWGSAGDAGRKRSLGGAIWTFVSDVKHVASSRVLGERGILKVMRQKDRNLRNILRIRVRRELKKADKRVNRRIG